MKSFFARLMCFILFVVYVEESAALAATQQQSLVLLSNALRKCPRAVAPRKIITSTCYPQSKFYQWIWTKDGQIQNVATGLCVDVDGISQDVPLRLSVCNFRKSFQKWRCQNDLKKKLFFVNPAHTGKYFRWRFLREKGKALLSALTTFEELSKIHILNANLCDFNHRDDKCFVFMRDGYVELPVPSKLSLEQFTISVWIKTPPNGQGAVFSYNVNSKMVFGFIMKPSKQQSEFYFAGKNLKLTSPSLPIMSGFWTHIAFTWSTSTGNLIYYVNGDMLLTLPNQKASPFPGSGTLRLGHVVNTDDVFWFSGYISQLNIFSRVFTDNEVGVLAAKLHCCNSLPQGDWLSWGNVMESGKKFSDVRENSGAECTSFEALSRKWLMEEQSRWTCRTSLSVADPRFIPDHHFTASSSTPREVPWNGRASKQSSKPWCPDKNDRNSYLQVDLGAVKNVTAVGTGVVVKYKTRHAKRFKIHSSKDGIYWKNGGEIYEASSKVNPPVKIIPLSSPVLARYLRFYPTPCVPPSCCLSVEVFGCDPELEKKIFEGEDGCGRIDKPYILMDLGEMHHVRRIKIRAQSQNHKKPIQGFSLYYMSWNQWVPYQIDGKTKVFKGTSESKRSFVHILQIPILTRLIKIFPVPYVACADFEFIGCRPSHADFCDSYSLHKSRDCAKVEVPQCKLGFHGNGHVCIDVNECDVTHGAYCDQNSVCKNKVGYYECQPCRNGFIGDGKSCQTSCEALGIVCGENSFCDVNECQCHDGYYNNGTHCVEDEPENGNGTGETLTGERIDGICSDGFFNCYGDVIGALNEIRKTSNAYSTFDHNECDDAPLN